MSLVPPEKVEKLQAALRAKAKRSPGYRFYLLYDKVYRRDVLSFAYALCYANGGAAGVDGMTFDDITEYGTDRWLDELAETSVAGSASGWVPSTTSRVGGRHDSPMNTCTTSCTWFGTNCELATSRGRTRETLSESRMREIRMSGLMSGMWKRSTVCGY